MTANIYYIATNCPSTYRIGIKSQNVKKVKLKTSLPKLIRTIFGLVQLNTKRLAFIPQNLRGHLYVSYQQGVGKGAVHEVLPKTPFILTICINRMMTVLVVILPTNFKKICLDIY